jgi:hypothetical protein
MNKRIARMGEENDRWILWVIENVAPVFPAICLAVLFYQYGLLKKLRGIKTDRTTC